MSRIPAVVIWAHGRTTTPELINMLRQDASMTDPSRVCGDACAMYGVIITSLLYRDDVQQSWVPSTAERSSIAMLEAQRVIGQMHPTIQEWFGESSSITLDQIHATRNAGHLRWPFLLVLHPLRRCSPFRMAILQTCRLRGNTNANAAFVGAVMGALHGGHSIPGSMSQPVLLFHCTAPQWSTVDLGFTRPATYRIRDAMQLLPDLLAVEKMIMW